MMLRVGRVCVGCSGGARQRESVVRNVFPLASSMTKTFQNFIAGQWTAPESGAYFENRNPADTRDLIGHFPLSNHLDVERHASSRPRGRAAQGR
jgi:hypothetical protein